MKLQQSVLKLAFATCLAAAGSSAFAQAATVPLDQLGNTALTDASARGQTLSNGVTVTVTGAGMWRTYGILAFTNQPTGQTFTFSAPVNLSFTGTNLNCAGESIRFAGATVTPTAVHAAHAWDAATQTLSGRAGASGNETSTFTANNVTTLTLTPADTQNCNRGLSQMSATPVVSATSTAPTPVPADNPLALAAGAVLLAGAAARRFKRGGKAATAEK